MENTEEKDKAYKRLAQLLTTPIIQMRCMKEGKTSAQDAPQSGLVADAQMTGYHEESQLEPVHIQEGECIPDDDKAWYPDANDNM